MTQRIRNSGPIFNDRPFQGEGYSFYMNIGTEVLYRRLRILPPRQRRRRKGRGWIKGTGGVHDIANSVTKTARIASNSGSPITLQPSEIPDAFASQPVITSDVRHWKDDVENETDNYRTVTFGLDASKNIVQEILGTAVILSQEARAGGIVRLRLRYTASAEGIQPARFRAIATAGPTSPADATTPFSTTKRIHEIDTPALSDASSYTYTIRAENDDQSVTLDLITGLQVNADATGPPAPTNPLIQEW